MALGTKIESYSAKKDDQNVRIQLGYDAVKSMNLKGDDNESDEKKPDGYSHMMIHKYEISLFPFEGRLDSPFETHFTSISTEEEKKKLGGSWPPQANPKDLVPVLKKKVSLP